MAVACGTLASLEARLDCLCLLASEMLASSTSSLSFVLDGNARNCAAFFESRRRALGEDSSTRVGGSQGKNATDSVTMVASLSDPASTRAFAVFLAAGLVFALAATLLAVWWFLVRPMKTRLQLSVSTAATGQEDSSSASYLAPRQGALGTTATSMAGRVSGSGNVMMDRLFEDSIAANANAGAVGPRQQVHSNAVAAAADADPGAEDFEDPSSSAATSAAAGGPGTTFFGFRLPAWRPDQSSSGAGAAAASLSSSHDHVHEDFGGIPSQLQSSPTNNTAASASASASACSAASSSSSALSFSASFAVHSNNKGSSFLRSRSKASAVVPSPQEATAREGLFRSAQRARAQSQEALLFSPSSAAGSDLVDGAEEDGASTVAIESEEHAQQAQPPARARGLTSSALLSSALMTGAAGSGTDVP